ncbi:MAG: hypothetical protein NC906_08520, partial [Candidatus Omnitrophica bacterium]|nr:hypothetical protein [Candidatus Omnitrophota bacterium]
MEIIYYLIGLPVIAGLLCFLLSDRARILIWGIAFDVCLVLFGAISILFVKKPTLSEGMFMWDNLTNLTLLGTAFFGLIVCIYSYKMIDRLLGRYYGCFLLTIGAAIGVALSNNLILMSVFWGILAITLYLMINLGGPEAAYPAKKTLIIVGGSDSFLILGIAILWALTGSLNISEIKVEIDRWLAAAAF